MAILTTKLSTLTLPNYGYIKWLIWKTTLKTSAPLPYSTNQQASSTLGQLGNFLLEVKPNQLALSLQGEVSVG